MKQSQSGCRKYEKEMGPPQVTVCVSFSRVWPKGKCSNIQLVPWLWWGLLQFRSRVQGRDSLLRPSEDFRRFICWDLFCFFWVGLEGQMAQQYPTVAKKNWSSVSKGMGEEDACLLWWGPVNPCSPLPPGSSLLFSTSTGLYERIFTLWVKSGDPGGQWAQLVQG